ncbi:glia maturation factor gamma isoform X1 [Sminthopsis crassicaudata]|uniref:glia maturation factor gamma isoform X1 n=2 Tax=Sminthopsis crassicaudata TaxID=9301 RepID=UPI003D685EE4
MWYQSRLSLLLGRQESTQGRHPWDHEWGETGSKGCYEETGPSFPETLTGPLPTPGVHGQEGLLKADSLVVCEVDPELKEKLRRFRFRKDTTNAAIIMKVDKDRQMVVMEEEFQNISPEELRDELPERQPRFIVYSYKWLHEDGRVSYPLCFIFSSPVGCKPEQQMMYAGSKNRLVQTAELTKVFEIRTTDDLTETWLQEKLAFFR